MRVVQISTKRWSARANTLLDRKISEKIEISNFKGDILMNRKNKLGGAVVEREKFKCWRWMARGRK